MLIDSHCHLKDKRYEIPTDQIIDEAKQEGVTKIITIGTSLKDNQQAIELAENYENVYTAIGIYPHENSDKTPQELKLLLEDQIQEALETKKLVAIGECGIDINEWETERNLEDQIELFNIQIRLALNHDLPIVVHNRNGDDLVLSALQKYKSQNLRGVVHCYVSSWEFAQKILDLGLHISFTAIITYPSGIAIHETVKNVPNDRYLLETDAPYLPPQGHRKEVNSPKYVRIIAEKVAEIRNETFEKVSEDSYNNTCSLFGLPR
jgi:TatD DNase family protein